MTEIKDWEFYTSLQYSLFLVHSNDINLLGDNINTIMKNKEAVIDTIEEVGLEVNTKKIKCLLMSHHQNTAQNHNIKIANRSFQNMAKFKYLRKRVTNHKLTNEEMMKSNLSNACYIKFRTFCLLVYCLKT
jgi:hypothetical protein